ncbi:MAG: hypothetical protein ACT4OF_03175 [Caulobacteraceae bacterium]
MMDAEARLARAFGESAAPARDPAFTLAVIQAAERERFRAEFARSMLRSAGMAAAGASLVIMLAGWAALNWEGVQGGILGVGGIFALVAMSRLMTQRLAPAAAR